MTVASEASISLSNLKHHGGRILSKDPLRVETNPEQWDYAVSVQLAASAYEPPANRLPLTVTVDVIVESGELGCLIVEPDWRTLAGPPPPTVGHGHHLVRLNWERSGARAQLVFRNHGEGGLPCVFTVQSVQISAAPVDPFAAALTMDRVAQERKERLDLSVLAVAVAHPEQFFDNDREIFDYLRHKWGVVPAGLTERRGTAELKHLPLPELREAWITSHRTATTGDGYSARGWYQELYRDVLRGKKVLEVGSGMGIDGIEFARNGARMTFIDIVEDNLAVMKRLCEIFGIRDARFLHLEELSSLDALDNDYDVVWCQGSQINNPFGFARRECEIILRHLKPGGRWIELAYPRERWVRDGRPSFRIWGTITDGEGTPWVEWYDLEKLLRRLAPARFTPVLSMNFHNDDFNWFDLLRLE